MEQIEVVHETTGLPLGIFMGRTEVIEKKAWCRSTNVFVMNTKGEILCHQRSLVKERMPGVWVTHLGGHVADGETPETNVLKELEEEANIIVPASNVIRWSTMPVEETTRCKNVRLWMHNFVALFDGDMSIVKAQAGEVEQFAWFSLEQILNEEKNNPGSWNSGIHNFHIEYFHLRAALMGAHAAGTIQVPDELHVWRPIAA